MFNGLFETLGQKRKRLEEENRKRQSSPVSGYSTYHNSSDDSTFISFSDIFSSDSPSYDSGSCDSGSSDSGSSDCGGGDCGSCD